MNLKEEVEQDAINQPAKVDVANQITAQTYTQHRSSFESIQLTDQKVKSE